MKRGYVHRHVSFVCPSVRIYISVALTGRTSVKIGNVDFYENLPRNSKFGQDRALYISRLCCRQRKTNRHNSSLCVKCYQTFRVGKEVKKLSERATMLYYTYLTHMV